MKKCSMCGEMKGLEHFYKDRHRIDGHGNCCKPCFRARQAIYTKRPPRVQTPPGTKYCSDCKTVLPISEFWANKTFHDGIDRMCKVCRYSRHGKWRKNNLDKLNKMQMQRYYANLDRYADYELKKRLGIASGTYDEMLARQNGACAICGTADPGTRTRRRTRRFAVDHCHDTGAIRGLLCSNCNRGIGYLKHDTSILYAAIKYLSPRTGVGRSGLKSS